MLPLLLGRIVAVGGVVPNHPSLHEGVPLVPKGYPFQTDPRPNINSTRRQHHNTPSRHHGPEHHEPPHRTVAPHLSKLTAVFQVRSSPGNGREGLCTTTSHVSRISLLWPSILRLLVSSQLCIYWSK